MIPLSPSNRLISILPRRDRQHLLAASRHIYLEPDDILAQSGERIRHVYFPIDGFISLTTRMDGERGLDVGLVGDEGMLGIELLLGVDVAQHNAMVQGMGPALCMNTATFRRQLLRSSALQRLLKRYALVLMGQLARNVVCTRYHMVVMRLARLLLMTQDRARSDRVDITHDALACRLGVRRAGITAAATALQRDKLIRYHRGKVLILDRIGLQRAACNCYGVDLAIYARTLDHGREKPAQDAG